MAIEEGVGSGFNPSAALDDITNAGSQMKEIAEKMEMAGADLFASLKNNWASPKAQEFAARWSGKLYYTTVSSVLIAANSFISRLTEAYNTIAIRQGCPTIAPPVSFTINDEATFGSLNERDYNGNVGINTSVVRRIVQTYRQTVNAIINLLHDMNIKLAILDETGEVARELQQSANALASELDYTISDISKQIEAVNETEVDTVVKAVSETAATVASAGSRTTSTAPSGESGFYPNKSNTSNNVETNFNHNIQK